MTRVDVVCYFDNNFVDLFFLFASSIAASRADGTDVVLHAFHQDLAEADLARLKRFHLPGLTINDHLFDIDVPRFREYRLPSCVYHRLYLHRKLPDLDRVVYLDVDMIVLADLAPLATIDLGDHAVAAVADYVLFAPIKAQWTISTDHFTGSFHDYLVDLGVDPHRTDDYFNTGLMVLDLKKLRQSGLAEDMIREAEAASDRYLFGDQCLINAMVGCRHLELGIAWNVLFAFHQNILSRRPDLAEELKAAKASAKIAHYAGPKPWTAGFEGDGIHFWTLALATNTAAFWQDRFEAAMAGRPAAEQVRSQARLDGAVGRARPLALNAAERLRAVPVRRRGSVVLGMATALGNRWALRRKPG